MSIYIPIQKDDRPAYDKALACEEDFQKLLVVVSEVSVREEPGEEIKEYHEKFTLWARRLCVFSDSRVSLDSRLEDYPSGYGVVSATLDLLKSSLNQSFWFKTPTPSEDVEFRYKRKPLARALKIMHDAVDGLLDFADIMHLSSMSTLAAKAKTFDLNMHPSEITKFEKETLQLVNQHADGIEETLADRLTMGITFRRIRLLYETTHDKKLQSRPYVPLPVFNLYAALNAPAESSTSQLDLPSTAELEAIVTSTTMDGSTHTSADTLSDVDEIDSSDEEDDASVASSDLDDFCPQPPRLGYEEHSCRCTWCPEILDESDINTPGWWREHVKTDLDIYVCISDDCCNPTVYFKTFSEWHKHMKKAHGSNWSQEVYALHYFCDMCSCSYLSFTNRHKFVKHMNDQHDHELTNAQMDTKLQCNFTTIPREADYCPICNRNIFTGLKLRSQLLKKPNKGKEREHVPQPQRRIEVEDSDELSTSDSDESIESYRVDDAEAQRQAKLVSVNRRKLARHVGRHLKELAFLSIRDLGHTPRPVEFDPESSVPEMSSTESESDTESELGESRKSGAHVERQPPEAEKDQTMDDLSETQESRSDTSNASSREIEDQMGNLSFDKPVSENEDEPASEQSTSEMFIGQRMWRIRDVPHSWTKRNLTDALRHHSDLQVANALSEDDNGAFVHTLADAGRHQHATVRFQRLPEKLATLDISDELEIGIISEFSAVDHFKIDQHFDGFTFVFSPPEPPPPPRCGPFVIAFADFGNHPFESFMNPQDGHMWLSDSLPLEIPTATVLIYGYKRWQHHILSSTDVQNVMEKTWEELAERSFLFNRYDELVLISHGLGGLLCGAAEHILADSPSQCIRLSGLISFGFPHSDQKDKQLHQSDTVVPIRLATSKHFSRLLAHLRETMFRKGVSHRWDDKIFCFHQRHVSQTTSEGTAADTVLHQHCPGLPSASNGSSPAHPRNLEYAEISKKHSQLVQFDALGFKADYISYLLRHIYEKGRGESQST